MLFQSLEFLIFFVVTLAIYCILDRKGQNLLLLVASYVFYGMWDWRFCGLIALSTVIDFCCANQMAASREAKKRKLLLSISILSNLSILGFFKYFNFFSDNLIQIFNVFGWQPGNFTLNIILPVGISFYTFQSMSYTIDVYRKELSPTKRFLDFALFVSMFTQLIAGPIERAKHLLPQIVDKRQLSLNHLYEGSWLFSWGLFKKIVVADHLAKIANPIFSSSFSVSGGESLLALYVFAFQIFCDFSGYTDMARGLTKIMGFNLCINFRSPYLVTNPSSFWKHWHISLSSWLKDYLYIPLGGNRGSSIFTLRNLFITMLLGGLWHGAQWNFVIWGAYHGILLILYHLIRPYTAKIIFKTRLPKILWHFLCILFMFHLTCLGWLIFRVEHIGDCLHFFSSITESLPGLIPPLGASIKFLYLIIPILIAHIYESKSVTIESFLKAPIRFRVATYTFLIVSIMFWGGGYDKEFIYFQF